MTTEKLLGSWFADAVVAACLLLLVVGCVMSVGAQKEEISVWKQAQAETLGPSPPPENQVFVEKRPGLQKKVVS